MRGVCMMTSTMTERVHGTALQRLDRTNRIQPSAQDADDPYPELRFDLPLLQPRCTSDFVPTILAQPEMHIVYWS